MDLRAPAAPGTRDAAAQGANGCVIHELSRRSLRLGGDPVYVAPLALSVSGGETLIAGYPNYVWTSTGNGHKRDAMPDGIFGVVVDEDGTVRAVPNPMPGHLNFPYAVALPSGGWRIVFMELAQSRRENSRPKVLGIWSALFDGRRWSDLERLPLPKEYTIYGPGDGSLLRVGDTLSFAVMVDPLNQVLLFEHAKGQWSWERVLVPSNKRHPEPVTVVHLALIPWQPGGLALLVNKNYPTVDSIYNSLMLYTREPGWREHTLVLDIKRFVNSQFAVSTSPAGDVVSWGAGDAVFAFRGNIAHGSLRALVVDTAVSRNPETLNSIEVRLTKLAGGAPLWITQHMAADEAAELRLFVARADSAVRIGTIALPSTFARLLAATEAAPGELLVAGAHSTIEGSDSLLASLVMRERVHCSASER